MALEIARIDISPLATAVFEAAAAEAVALFRGADGCRSMRLLRSHEAEHRYWLFVEWRDVAAHNAFRDTPAFGRWRELVGPHFLDSPIVEHGLLTGIGFER